MCFLWETVFGGMRSRFPAFIVWISNRTFILDASMFLYFSDFKIFRFDYLNSFSSVLYIVQKYSRSLMKE